MNIFESMLHMFCFFIQYERFQNLSLHSATTESFTKGGRNVDILQDYENIIHLQKKNAGIYLKYSKKMHFPATRQTGNNRSTNLSKPANNVAQNPETMVVQLTRTNDSL